MVLCWLQEIANSPFRRLPQDCILGNFQPSLRDWSSLEISSQDYVLGLEFLHFKEGG
jgi:hypothetical protein